MPRPTAGRWLTTGTPTDFRCSASPNSRQLQKLGRIDGTGAQDGLTLDLVGHLAARGLGDDPNRAVVRGLDPLDSSIRLDMQIGFGRLVQHIGVMRVEADALADIALRDVHAFLLVAVMVFDMVQAHLLSGVQECAI